MSQKQVIAALDPNCLILYGSFFSCICNFFRLFMYILFWCLYDQPIHQCMLFVGRGCLCALRIKVLLYCMFRVKPFLNFIFCFKFWIIFYIWFWFVYVITLHSILRDIFIVLEVLGISYFSYSKDQCLSSESFNERDSAWSLMCKGKIIQFFLKIISYF